MRQLTRALDKLTVTAPAEAVVRARAEALLAYLADVPVAILVANNRARYVDANRQAIALTGYSRSQLISMALSDLTPNPNVAMGRRLWRDFLRRGRMGGRYPIRRKNGTLLKVDYLAIANVLPGVHVSALVPVPAPRRQTRRPTTTRRR